MSVISIIPDHYQVQYDSNLGIALQQETSLLREAVTIKNGTGESIRFDEIGTVEATDVTTRGGDTVYTDLDSSQRWVRPMPAECALKRDVFDLDHLGNLVGLDGGIVRVQGAAINRVYDNRIISGMLGTAYSGKTGTTTNALDTTNMAVAANYVPSGTPANSGLTFYKLAAAKYKLDRKLLPKEGRYIAVTSKQVLNLVNDIIANHTDNGYAMEWAKSDDPVSKRLFNFNFIEFSDDSSMGVQLPVASNVRTCPFWHKSGVGFGIWTDRLNFIDRLPTKRQAMSFYAATNVGATRLDEKKVGVIYADESV